LGRKNHYGSRSERGTEVAALFYSLIESAKLAGVNAGPWQGAKARRPRWLRQAALARQLRNEGGLVLGASNTGARLPRVTRVGSTARLNRVASGAFDGTSASVRDKPPRRREGLSDLLARGRVIKATHERQQLHEAATKCAHSIVRDWTPDFGNFHSGVHRSVLSLDGISSR
jgi:hypothetical protein